MNRGRKAQPLAGKGRPRTAFPGVPNSEVVTTAFEVTRQERDMLRGLPRSMGISQGTLVRGWIRRFAMGDGT